MTYKPREPNKDIGRAKPFWEEVPDGPPPKYEAPENPLQKPFWEKGGKPISLSTAMIWFILITFGAAALWLNGS